MEDPDGVLKNSIDRLTQRNKELNCLFAISKIVEQQDLSLERTIQDIVDILPGAWLRSEDIRVRILLDGRAFTTRDFAETAHRQMCDLTTDGLAVGSLEVFYESPEIANEPKGYFQEEADFLEAVAERLCKMIRRHRTEEALQRSEQRFRNLVENTITGISIIQGNRIVYQNREQEKLLGPLPRTSLLGDYDHIHPDDVETVMQASRAIQSGQRTKFDLDFRLIKAGDGEELLLKRVFCRVLPMEYQGRESILVNVIDMTKIMELEQLLFRQDKMASLGRVAAGIAHEIRNPLSGINIYLTALQKMVDQPGSRDKVAQIIAQLKSASRKIESVIKKVMDFAKPSEPKFSRIDPNKPVEDAMNLTAVTLRKSGIRMENRLDKGIAPCYADANLIEVAVLNLLNNAAEAMRNVDKDKKIVVSSGSSGKHIFIRVSDSGPGVSAEIGDKVFDPFFTTKRDGTGIGLSLCHRIASDHHGILRLGKSRLGGAAFTIEIPVKKESPSNA
ncbi:MAG: PAS domain S-box protein [Deltaproteobacteria bacterium]|nr:PAS domain S-box protein [Deltaproteobacteria bacterium]